MTQIKKVVYNSFIHFFDQKNKYLLIVSKKEVHPFMKYVEVAFLAPYAAGFTNQYVVGREFGETPKLLKYKDSTNIQIIDVGAGFHEFIPSIASKQIPGQPKPIIIDPFNYDVAYTLLDYAEKDLKNDGVPKRVLSKINLFKTYAGIITNPEKVRLYNMPVREALNFSELKNIGDLVVSCYVNIDKETLDYFVKHDGEIIKY